MTDQQHSSVAVTYEEDGHINDEVYSESESENEHHNMLDDMVDDMIADMVGDHQESSYEEDEDEDDDDDEDEDDDEDDDEDEEEDEEEEEEEEEESDIVNEGRRCTSVNTDDLHRDVVSTSGQDAIEQKKAEKKAEKEKVRRANEVEFLKAPAQTVLRLFNQKLPPSRHEYSCLSDLVKRNRPYKKRATRPGAKPKPDKPRKRWSGFTLGALVAELFNTRFLGRDPSDDSNRDRSDAAVKEVFADERLMLQWRAVCNGGLPADTLTIVRAWMNLMWKIHTKESLSALSVVVFGARGTVDSAPHIDTIGDLVCACWLRSEKTNSPRLVPLLYGFTVEQYKILAALLPDTNAFNTYETVRTLMHSLGIKLADMKGAQTRMLLIGIIDRVMRDNPELLAPLTQHLKRAHLDLFNISLGHKTRSPTVWTYMVKPVADPQPTMALSALPAQPALPAPPLLPVSLAGQQQQQQQQQSSSSSSTSYPLHAPLSFEWPPVSPLVEENLSQPAQEQKQQQPQPPVELPSYQSNDVANQDNSQRSSPAEAQTVGSKRARSDDIDEWSREMFNRRMCSAVMDTNKLMADNYRISMAFLSEYMKSTP